MATFYENAGICCMQSRLRSVFSWLGYNVWKVSSDIHSRHPQHQYGQPPPPPPPSTTPSSGPATSVRPDHPTVPVTLVATSDNRMEHTAHVHSVSVSTSRERRRRRRSGTSSASVSQPQPPQASSWPPCQRWSRVSPSSLHSKAPTGSQGHAGVPAIWSFI